MSPTRILSILALGALAIGAASARPATAQNINAPLGAGDVVITEFFQHLFRIDPATGGKTPLDPGLFNPTEIIAVDAARQILAIDRDDRLVRFDPVTLSVTPLTTTLFPSPVDIAVESSGTILVASESDIYRVNPTSGATTTLVDHANVNGGFFGPAGIDVGPTGRIFVTEFFEDLWEINPTTGAATQTPQSRDLVLADSLEVRTDGSLITREFDTGNFIKINPATGAIVDYATDVPTFVFGIALDENDDVLVASDVGVFRYNAATGAKTTLTPDETFFTPGGIAVAPGSSPTTFAADFDGDLDVDHDDFVIWRNGFGLAAGAAKPQGDASADGDVDGGDFLVWQRQLGVTPLAAVPEPGALALFGAALIAGAIVRRRAHDSGCMTITEA